MRSRPARPARSTPPGCCCSRGSSTRTTTCSRTSSRAWEMRCISCPWVETLILPTVDEMTPEESLPRRPPGLSRGDPQRHHRAHGLHVRDPEHRGAPRGHARDARLRHPRLLRARHARPQSRQRLARPVVSAARRGLRPDAHARAGVPERAAGAERPAGPRHDAHDDGRRPHPASRSTRSARAARSRSTWASTPRSGRPRSTAGASAPSRRARRSGSSGPRSSPRTASSSTATTSRSIARTGTQVSYNPVSNMYLGNGFAPVLDMFELGIDVSLASDGGACGNTEDMLEVLKFGVLHAKGGRAGSARLQRPRRAARRDRRAAPRRSGSPPTSARSRSAGWPTCSCSTPIGSRSVPMHDPISTLVYAGSQSNVDTVDRSTGTSCSTPGASRTSTRTHSCARCRSARSRWPSASGTFRLMRGRRFTPFRYDRVGTEASARPARAGEAGAADPRPISATASEARPAGLRTEPSGSSDETRARHAREGCGGCCSTTARSSPWTPSGGS